MRLPKGAECQCVQCRLFFTGLTAFDKHQSGARRGRAADTPVVCREPGDVGLVIYERKNGPTWGVLGDNPYGT